MFKMKVISGCEGRQDAHLPYLKPAWTLVLRGGYLRPWGFFTARGWQYFRDYFKERGC